MPKWLAKLAFWRKPPQKAPKPVIMWGICMCEACIDKRRNG
jgi:hypothetical protein